MTPTIETILEPPYLLPPFERQQLIERLSHTLTQKSNGNGAPKHFQETATEEEWKSALRTLADEPRIIAPDISAQSFRRDNLYNV